jgi:hypothetical protein
MFCQILFCVNRSGLNWTRSSLNILEYLVNISWTERFRKYSPYCFLKLVGLYTVDKGVCYSCHTHQQCRLDCVIKTAECLQQTTLLESESQNAGGFCKLRKETVCFFMSVCLSVHPSVCPSLHPRGTTGLQLDEFSWNLLLSIFSNICTEISNFIKIWQQ